MAATPLFRQEVCQRREICGSPASPFSRNRRKKGVACHAPAVLASRAPDEMALRG
jgi:hypothetical protein